MRTAIILAALIALPAPAAAQNNNCQPRDTLVRVLADKYQEHRRAYAMASPQQILELFTSDSGSWTAVISQPGGISCIVGAGQNWTEVDERPEPGRPL